MGHDLQNEDLLAGVENAGDQPILVAADIEDDAVTDDAGTPELGFDLAPRLPGDCPAVDVSVPSSERPLGRAMARNLPELSQPRLRDDPHPLLPPGLSSRPLS